MAKKLVPLAENYNIKIDEDVINPTYLPYLRTLNRFEIYYGGAGSGKSYFIAQKLALQLTTEQGRNLIAIRHQEKDCKDSCYPQLVKALKEFHLDDLWQIKEHPSPRMINRVNGNEIAFTGLDDVENIKSVTFKNGNASDFWVEEATEIESVTDIRELNRRLRDPKTKGRIIISFNPVSRTHWLFDFVTKEVITKNHMVLKTIYKDNRFLPQEYINELESLQYVSPYEYMVYALGEWGSMGQSVFNTKAIHERLVQLQHKYFKTPYSRIEFSFIRHDNGLPDKDSFTSFSNVDGETAIYKFPEKGHPYVLAFDTAGEGSDYYAAHVLDNITGEQVAVFHSQRDPDICILQIYGLGQMYNWALMCPEVNFDSYPLKKLEELDYPKIYQRISPADNYNKNYQQKLGFRTTAENRQRILSELVEWANNNINLINDADTLNEMLTFTRQSRKLKGIFWAAENGAKDDLVMSLAIALQAREQQDATLQTQKVELKGHFLKAELDILVNSGNITKYEAQQYMKKHGIEQPKKTLQDAVGRIGRYVRKKR